MTRPEGLNVRPQDLGFGRLFESVRDAVIVAEAGTGRIILWNPAATKIFGYSQSEAFDGLRIEALVPERFKTQHQAGITRYHETGHGQYIDSHELLDLPATRKTGEEIRIELSLSPIEPVHDPRGDERFVLAIVRDVTDRKRAEEEVGRLNEDLENQVKERTTRLEVTVAELKSREQALRASEERFRLLVEGAKDYAILMLDPEGRVASWNQGAERLLGYREAEIAGHHFSRLFTPEEARQGVPELELRRAVDEGRAENERWHVRKDGTRFWASGVVTPLLDKVGNLRGFSKVMSDFTERRGAEEALRMSETRFRTMIEQSPLSIQILSPDGRTLRVNRAWEELWGVTLDDIEGYNLLEDQQLVAKGVMPYIQRSFAGEPTPIPPIAYDPDETIPNLSSHEEPKRWVQAFIYPVKDEAGNIREVVLMHEDVTERKRIEEALREVREAERSRMARDLHDGALQDLSYALMEAQIVQEISEDPELAHHRLERATEALKRGVRELRDAVYDLSLGEERNEPFPNLLWSLVESNRSKMAPGCCIGLAVEEGFPLPPLGGIGTELLRVLQEALTNVRRHSGARNVLVSLEAEGGELVAEVEDDGRGFGAETAAGVGLRSMRERVTALGGELEVESEPGKGTRVRLRVPLRT